LVFDLIPHPKPLYKEVFPHLEVEADRTVEHSTLNLKLKILRQMISSWIEFKPLISDHRITEKDHKKQRETKKLSKIA